MEALTAQFMTSLRTGEPDPELLRRAGDADPVASAGAFRSAAEDPDLATRVDAWAPALLCSARPGFGAHMLASLARAVRESSGRAIDLEHTPVLPRLVASSNFLARYLLRHPGFVGELAGDVPDPPAPLEPDANWSAFRRAKYRGLLRIAGRDLAGRPFHESLRELSDLADRCLAAALRCAAAETGVADPALLALGKLGGRELNFSSDVDLLFLHDAPRESAPQRNEEVTALIRRFKTGLEEPTEEGFGYRVDLDLRPEGRSGVLSNSVEAALDYYEAFGAEWERQMLIRLRPVAGAPGAADAFRLAISPFVYRRLIDPGVLDEVRDMKLRIESERRSAGRDLEADLKEGPGGIRDVEFLVQSLQLFLGGRHPELRTGNVLEALSELEKVGALTDRAVASLRDAYTWLRRAEHAQQLVEEQQTSAFPRDPAEQTALARRMGYVEADAERSRAALLGDWTSVRDEVRGHFDALVLRRAE